MESLWLVASILRGFYCFLLFLTALFLILLVLIQRGRGGGLAGAFGGMGGQSAFGTKAGDTFTKVTIVVATFWIVLCILGVKYGVNEPSKMADVPGLNAAPGDAEQPVTSESDLEPPGEEAGAAGVAEPSASGTGSAAPSDTNGAASAAPDPEAPATPTTDESRSP